MDGDVKLMQTIRDLVGVGDGPSPAMLAPGGVQLTFTELRGTIDRLAGQLAASGVGREDRVAIVLPGGVPLAVAFLAVASCATAAPLNPKYRDDEFRFYLDDLGAKALITAGPGEAPAAHAAASPRMRRLTLVGAASELTLVTDDRQPVRPGSSRAAQPDDVALVLHTSGTTARPKIVPLRQRNLTASARNIVGSLSLTSADRCLNVMPLFHIHGLLAGLLAPLAAGGSVACPPGFDPFKFFAWLDELRPTWYTAVPTMHQMILARAERHRDVVERAPLRFVRSSSAPLPKVVIEGIEKIFGVPVIEAYGMTEASHQMASNPLPPDARKPGSVGKRTGVEVQIMDGAGRVMPAGERGEVVVRGETVIKEYEANPEANARAFTADGWFRTGDQGYLDEAGYLFLTGRLKEIINRGGEKVSPPEVDEVLLRHPAVAQAVAFAVPHERLGEEVAAALVLREGMTVTEREMREFAGRHLADFKVPRLVVFVDEIPKGPTGKLQRIGLAERLGLTA